LRSVERYDPDTDEWTTLASMNVKRSRVSLVANCGRLYAVGGYDGNTNLASMEVWAAVMPTAHARAYGQVYTPEEGVWRFAASMVAHEGGVGIGVVPTGVQIS
jgi:kelch-like protein 18